MMKRFTLIGFYIFLAGNLFAQSNVAPKIKNSAIYAGIEVGSKGVKMSILELSAQQNNDFKTIKDTSINTDFISFTDQTFANTLDAFTQLYIVATQKYQIEPKSIFTAISSGVSIMAEKENKVGWLQKLSDDFIKAINEPSRLVKVIDVKEEARLSHIGIIPDGRRYNTFLIDIGSGNTKGGFFPYNNTKDIRLFQLTWGTKSVSNETEKRLEVNNNGIGSFSKELYRVLAGSADKEIVYAVNVSGAYNMSDNIAFSGGIAWSVATLLFPELVENSVVPVTYDEVAGFMERIEKDYNSLSPEEITKSITDNSVDKIRVAKETKTVNKVFDQKALLSGTGLLLKIMRQFEGTYEKKQFFLVKNGQTGWISAFVNESKMAK
ncbi:MAG: hypothetical protein ABIP68_09770 [Ferruginibacter sp.]